MNGEREATETITMESCNGDLILGSNNAYSNNFDGAMDETRIWTVARSQEEIEQNMGLQVSATDESDLLIYYINANLTELAAQDFTQRWKLA